MTNQDHSCSEKITYESREEARASITANSYHYKKPALDVYNCRKCNLYHVTNRTTDEQEPETLADVSGL